MVHCWPRKLWQRLYSQRLDRQLLETYSQTTERLPQVVWILHLHNSKHIGIGVGGGGGGVGFMLGKCTWENAAAFAYEVQRIPEGKKHSGCGKQSQGCLQQGPVEAADGPAHELWSQPNTDLVDCRSSPGKNSGYAAWRLELCSSTPHDGPTARITALTSPVQYVHQEPGRCEQKDGTWKKLSQKMIRIVVLW